MLSKKYNVIDLFCGAGGLSEGFKQAGFEVILGVDNVQTFIDTFKENNPYSKTICGDIRKISNGQIAEGIGDHKVHVIVGGPPCQGFSIAGRRDPKDPRNSLFMEFVRCLHILKPDVFIMENVSGLLSMKTASGDKVSDLIAEEFENAGYSVKYKTLLAANYGVPQKRRRVIFIGTKRGHPILRHPQPTHAKEKHVTLDGRAVDKWIGVGSVLLPKEKVEDIFFHSQKMIDGFRKRKEYNREKGNGFGWQILRPNEPSFTISARYWKDGADAIVRYSENCTRMLTPRECARIQSFPDSYVFKGSKRETYMQIGNAVPPRMAKAIAENVVKYLDALNENSSVDSSEADRQ